MGGQILEKGKIIEKVFKNGVSKLQKNVWQVLKM